jgi:hypothetical protein
MMIRSSSTTQSRLGSYDYYGEPQKAHIIGEELLSDWRGVVALLVDGLPADQQSFLLVLGWAVGQPAWGWLKFSCGDGSG